MRIYHKLTDILSKILSALAIGTLIVMLVIMSVEVVRRYIFGVTFPWSDEIIRLLLVFCAYLGGAVAYHNHGLVCFDLLTNRLPPRVQDVLQLVNAVIMNVFLLFALYVVGKKMVSPAVVKSVSTASGLSGAVPYYGIFIGIVFLLLFTVDFYPELIRNAFRGRPAKEEEK